MRGLSPAATRRTSARVTNLFDMKLRALRRDRAARTGAELFLFERAFADCLDRIELLERRFDRAVLIGCPDASWPGRLAELAIQVDVLEPGPIFAAAAAGEVVIEDAWAPEPQLYDLVVALGTLDTVNDLPLALRLIQHGMAGNALFIGAVAGGNSLPALRAAMREADALGAGAFAHVHPRIEPAALAPLLEAAGFVKPVVDIDRVQLTYPSLGKLVADLRAMAATNVLQSRSPPLSRAAASAAHKAFAALGQNGRTAEMMELLHFAAWTPAQG
jgi:hypothetical protein